MTCVGFRRYYFIVIFWIDWAVFLGLSSECQNRSKHQRNSFLSATDLMQSGSMSRRQRMTWQSSSSEQQSIFTHFLSSQSLSNSSVTQFQTHSMLSILTQRRSKYRHFFYSDHYFGFTKKIGKKRNSKQNFEIKTASNLFFAPSKFTKQKQQNLFFNFFSLFFLSIYFSSSISPSFYFDFSIIYLSFPRYFFNIWEFDDFSLRILSSFFFI